MAFSIGRTWSEAFALVRERWAGLLIVTAIVQVAAFAALYPIMAPWFSLFETNLDPDAAAGRMMQLMPRMMGLSMLANLAQLAAWSIMVAMLAPGRPRIWRAVVAGLKAMPTVLVSIIFLMIGCYIGLLVIILVIAAAVAGIAATQGTDDAGLLGGAIIVMIIAYFFALAGMLYMALRFVTLVPVAVIERQYNPFSVIARSWKQTAGNGWAIVAFWLLLLIPYCIVLSAIVLTLFPSLFSLNGAVFASQDIRPMWLITGPLQIGFTVLSVAAVVATHRQLTNGAQGEAS